MRFQELQRLSLLNSIDEHKTQTHYALRLERCYVSNWPQINLSKIMVSLQVKFCGLCASWVRVCVNRYFQLQSLFSKLRN